MDAAVRADELGQGVEVGALDLGALAVLEDVGHDLVVAGEVGEDLGVGGVEALAGLLEAGGGQAHHVEEDVRELLRRVEVELLPRLGADGGDHGVDLGAEARCLLGQDVRVAPEALALHLQQHEGERHLDRGEELERAVPLQGLAQHVHERELGQDVEGLLRRLVGRLGHGAAGEGGVLVELGRREGARVGVEQVAGDGDVEEVRGVEVGDGDERLQDGVSGDDLVEKGLHVGADEPALEREVADGRAQGVVTLDAQQLVARGAPQHAGLLLGEEGLLALLRLGGLKLCRDRGAVGDGGVERRARSVARKGLGNLQGGCGRDVHARLGTAEAKETGDHAREAERGEGVGDGLGLEGGELGVGEVELDGRVGADGRDLAADERVVDVGAQVLAHLPLHLVGVGDDLVEAAVLDDEGGGLLGADAGHAGDVVGRVALEAVEVGDELGRDAVVEVVDALGRHDLHVGDALLGGDDLHVLGGELVHVAVAGEEEHLKAGLLAAAGERAEDVVTLPALELDHGHVERAQQVLHHGELLVEGGVHRRALGLVLRQHVDADLGLAAVEGADDAVGLEGLDQLDEHVEEAEERVGRAAVRRAHGLADRVEGAVHQGVAVDDGDGPSRLLGARGAVVLRGLGDGGVCHAIFSLRLGVPLDCSGRAGRVRSAHTMGAAGAGPVALRT